MKVVLGCLINFCLIYESVRPLLKHVHRSVCVAFFHVDKIARVLLHINNIFKHCKPK